MHGLIVSSFGRQFIVEIDGKHYQTVTKGKATRFVVGDIVESIIINDAQARIEQLIPRRNLIYRSDARASKIIASNLDQVIIVISAKPSFYSEFLNSCLVCCETSEITPLIVVNKIDLPESQNLFDSISRLYNKQLNYPLISICASEGCEQLMPYLNHKRSLLIGQSGVGKSTITNQIYPAAKARTGNLAVSNKNGRHTTTNATLYHINDTSELIDCPGLSEFGLYHLDAQQAANYFPEMRNFLGQCRFNNCHHINEPNCAIITAVNSGVIDQQRYLFYLRLMDKLKNKLHY